VNREGMLGDHRTPMQFQKNAWVDTKVCEEIARQFVEHKKDIHGDDWVLLFCDNLKAN